MRFYQDVDPAYRKPGQARAPRRDDFEGALWDIEAGVIRGIVFFKLDRVLELQGWLPRAYDCSGLAWRARQHAGLYGRG